MKVAKPRFKYLHSGYPPIQKPSFPPLSTVSSCRPPFEKQWRIRWNQLKDLPKSYWQQRLTQCCLSLVPNLVSPVHLMWKCSVFINSHIFLTAARHGAALIIRTPLPRIQRRIKITTYGTYSVEPVFASTEDAIKAVSLLAFSQGIHKELPRLQLREFYHTIAR